MPKVAPIGGDIATVLSCSSRLPDLKICLFFNHFLDKYLFSIRTVAKKKKAKKDVQTPWFFPALKEGALESDGARFELCCCSDHVCHLW